MLKVRSNEITFLKTSKNVFIDENANRILFSFGTCYHACRTALSFIRRCAALNVWNV
jgi:hypothetical protein